MENITSAKKITTNYSYGIKDILLTIVTFGIWRIIRYAQLVNDMNTVIEGRPNAKKGMNYWIVCVIGLVTCGFFRLGYTQAFFQFVGDEAKSRGIQTNLSAATYLLWGVLGWFIFVGPFICDKKLFETAVAIKKDYNARG